MIRYEVDLLNNNTGALTPIDTITAPDGYTSKQYVKDCMDNAPAEWCEMLEQGIVVLSVID